MRLAFGCILATCGVLACYLADPWIRDESLYLFCLSALAIVPVVVLKPSGLDYVTFVLLTPTAHFSLEAMFRLGWLNIVKYNENSWFPVLSQESLWKAAVLVLAGQFMLWLGYLVPFSRKLGELVAGKLSSYLDAVQVEPAMVRIWIAFLVGIAARLYMISSGISGYFADLGNIQEANGYAQFLNLIDGFATLSVLLYASILLQAERPHWQPFFVMLGIELVTILMQGYKAWVFYRFYYLAIIYAVLRRRCPWQYLLFGAVALMFIFPIIEAARQAANDGRIERGNLVSIRDGLSQSARDTYGADSVWAQGQTTLDRIVRYSAQLEMLAMVIQYSDETGTRWYGYDYLYPFLGLVPRFIWPDKPSPSHGRWVYNVVYGLPGDSAETQTVPGDLYLNFGSVGVVAGLFVMGMLGRTAGSVATRVTSLRFLPVIPLIIHTTASPFADIGAQFSLTMRTVVLDLIILAFLVPRRRR